MPPEFLIGTRKYKTANDFVAVLIDKIQIDGKVLYKGYVEEAPHKELYWDEMGYSTLAAELALIEGIVPKVIK